MKHRIFRVSELVLLPVGLFLALPWSPAQTGSGFPAIHEDSQGQKTDAGTKINKPDMKPYMPSNSPMAPQNNNVFLRQHVSDTIRENMAMEIQLNQLAVERSHNAKLKSYAQQVLVQDQKIDLDAKRFAPRPSESLPIAELAGTRQAVDAKATDKKMRALTGRKFDEMYLVQMSNALRSDIQVGHSAYAMMDIPQISSVGGNLWTLSRKRMDELTRIASQNHVHIGTD